MAKPAERFNAVEYVSGFAVQDTVSGEEHWIGDGVDMLSDKRGRMLSPGSKGFLRKLQRSLNESESETLEAYFPEVYEIEAR